MTRGEAWVKWGPAAPSYFFYFDLDGHISLPFMLKIYSIIYFCNLFFFIPYVTPGPHHPVTVTTVDPAYEAIH